MMRFEPRQYRTEHVVPPMICCWCGAEFEHKYRCIVQARECGWLMGSQAVNVKQMDGTRRYEFLGECPDCQREAREKLLEEP